VLLPNYSGEDLFLFLVQSSRLSRLSVSFLAHCEHLISYQHVTQLADDVNNTSKILKHRLHDKTRRTTGWIQLVVSCIRTFRNTSPTVNRQRHTDVLPRRCNRYRYVAGSRSSRTMAAHTNDQLVPRVRLQLT